MPDVNGRKLAEEAVRRRPGLKVIFTTGYTANAVVHGGVLDKGVHSSQNRSRSISSPPKCARFSTNNTVASYRDAGEASRERRATQFVTVGIASAAFPAMHRPVIPAMPRF